MDGLLILVFSFLFLALLPFTRPRRSSFGIDVVGNSSICSLQNVACTLQRPEQNWSTEWTPSRPSAPKIWAALKVNHHGDSIPVLNISWSIANDASLVVLRATELCVTDISANDTVCVWFLYSGRSALLGRAIFSFDGFVVEPGRDYSVNLHNLPEPQPRDPDLWQRRHVSLPGCKEPFFKFTSFCTKRGSTWEPNLTLAVVHDALVITFRPSSLSHNYTVSLQNCMENQSREVVSMETLAMITVRFSYPQQAVPCNTNIVTLRPKFPACHPDCLQRIKTLEVPPTSAEPLVVLGPQVIVIIPAILGIITTLCVITAAAGVARGHCRKPLKSPHSFDENEGSESDTISVCASPRMVFLLYSNDHPLYLTLVLRFAAFLRRKCGVEVILDLWCVQEIGRVSAAVWTATHLAEVKRNKGLVLVLCSRGAVAKWQALCGSVPPLQLLEDLHSPIGDLFTPAMAFISGEILRPGAMARYAVAYFEDVSSAADIPDIFQTALIYQLMKHFEELFFRLQDREKYAPGIVLHAEGISFNDYRNEPCGMDLYKAAMALRSWQEENPRWFEDQNEQLHCNLDRIRCPFDDGRNAMQNQLSYFKPEPVSHYANQLLASTELQFVGNDLQTEDSGIEDSVPFVRQNPLLQTIRSFRENAFEDPIGNQYTEQDLQQIKLLYPPVEQCLQAITENEAVPAV
uniref:interleukin-17 receptor A-like isoform X2 n=1 Tax=Myxine glutinosa TaxID=7769 RepID=UPI00358DE50C